MKKDKIPLYTYEDLQWAFNEGIHEGILREHYKNDIGNFIKSDLNFYIKTCYTAPLKIRILKKIYNLI
jgi:hypothetical protein